jgi:hypothetical protein
MYYLKERGKVYSKPQKELGRFQSPVDADKAGFNREHFRGASVHETTGPNFKKILWVKGRPYVLK